MPEFRRNYQPGGTFFFTVVTYNRQPILCQPSAQQLLQSVIKDQQAKRPFNSDAIVLLPDHLHTVWTLPVGDKNFSVLWASIKATFTRLYLQKGASESLIRKGQTKENRRGIWQPRFMEHTIRDENDMMNHIDYIHYNPVKHGLVDKPASWAWSSFHRYVKQGTYPKHWGCRLEDVKGTVDRIDARIME